jgi:hypothetical protein
VAWVLRIGSPLYPLIPVRLHRCASPASSPPPAERCPCPVSVSGESGTRTHRDPRLDAVHAAPFSRLHYPYRAQVWRPFRSPVLRLLARDTRPAGHQLSTAQTAKGFSRTTCSFCKPCRHAHGARCAAREHEGDTFLVVRGLVDEKRVNRLLLLLTSMDLVGRPLWVVFDRRLAVE